jgi:hypothetical protein
VKHQSYIKHSFKSLAILCSLLLGIFVFTTLPAAKLQASTLLAAKDYISDDSVSKASVGHNISFTIPSTGHSLIPSDYIRLTFPNYSAVTAATSSSGWSGGSPIYSVTGNTVLITGVSATPNSGIGISGITTTNPALSSDFDVTIELANDSIGSIIYDSVVFDAVPTKGMSTVSVYIASNTSDLLLSGYTSPNAFVIISLDGGLAGTVTASSNGDFIKSLSGLYPGIHNVVIYTIDSQSRQSNAISLQMTLLPYTMTTVNNIVIPPTLGTDDSVYPQGKVVHITGLAHPSSQIIVFVNGLSAHTDVVAANAQGQWTYNLNSNDNPLEVGSYQIYAQEAAIGGYLSEFSKVITFSVEAQKTPEKIAETKPGINVDNGTVKIRINPQEFPWQHAASVLGGQSIIPSEIDFASASVQTYMILYVVIMGIMMLIVMIISRIKNVRI